MYQYNSCPVSRLLAITSYCSKASPVFCFCGPSPSHCVAWSLQPSVKVGQLGGSVYPDCSQAHDTLFQIVQRAFSLSPFSDSAWVISVQWEIGHAMVQLELTNTGTVKNVIVVQKEVCVLP